MEDKSGAAPTRNLAYILGNMLSAGGAFPHMTNPFN
jgi:hypothetical protein